MIDISKTIENIRATCNNYVDPDLVATVIHDNYFMGSNNILEIEKFDIKKEDSFEVVKLFIICIILFDFFTCTLYMFFNC